MASGDTRTRPRIWVVILARKSVMTASANHLHIPHVCGMCKWSARRVSSRVSLLEDLRIASTSSASCAR